MTQTSFLSALKYSAKVWLTSVLLAPLFIGILFGFYNLIRGIVYDFAKELLDGIGFVGMVAVYAFMFSIPSFILLTLSVWLTDNRGWAVMKRKSILTIISIALTLLPFVLLNFTDVVMLLYILPFLGMIVLGIWYYKIENN
jgi:hypothetical protein